MQEQSNLGGPRSEKLRRFFDVLASLLDLTRVDDARAERTMSFLGQEELIRSAEIDGELGRQVMAEERKQEGFGGEGKELNEHEECMWCDEQVSERLEYVDPGAPGDAVDRQGACQLECVYHKGE